MELKMSQNRNKLIDLFIGNMSNFIVHKILEKAINKEEISKRYKKEQTNSLEIAKKYRDKINPINEPLPNTDITYIKDKILNKVMYKLKSRISDGYDNIDLSSIENEVDTALKEAKIT